MSRGIILPFRPSSALGPVGCGDRKTPALCSQLRWQDAARRVLQSCSLLFPITLGYRHVSRFLFSSDA